MIYVDGASIGSKDFLVHGTDLQLSIAVDSWWYIFVSGGVGLLAGLCCLD